MKKLMLSLIGAVAAISQLGASRTMADDATAHNGAGISPAAPADLVASASPVDPDHAAVAQGIAARMEQLRREADGLKLATGKESEEERALKKAQAAEICRQIEACAMELQWLAGPQESGGGKSLAKLDQLPRHQATRQERRQRVREMKKLRAPSGAEGAP